MRPSSMPLLCWVPWPRHGGFFNSDIWTPFRWHTPVSQSCRFVGKNGFYILSGRHTDMAHDTTPVPHSSNVKHSRSPYFLRKKECVLICSLPTCICRLCSINIRDTFSNLSVNSRAVLPTESNSVQPFKRFCESWWNLTNLANIENLSLAHSLFYHLLKSQPCGSKLWC